MARKKPPETFEESIDKFATAATQFAVTQATHNERLNAIDGQMRNLQTEMHQLREFKQQQNTYLNNRIDAVQLELAGRLQDMDEKLDTQTVTLTNHIDVALKGVGSRLETVETWRYLVIGGTIVAGFLFSEFFLKLFGDAAAIDMLKKLL